MSLADVRHWVFDMDGTLTVAVHDFAAIRVALAIPAEDDILTHLAALPADEAAAKHAWLLEHERDLALGSKPAPGAVDLVRDLAGRGYRLGISRAMPVNWRMSRWRPLAWLTASRWRTCSVEMKRRQNRTPVVC